MNDEPKELLDELLQSEFPTALQTSLLDGMLAQVRRKRRIQSATKAALGTILLLVLLAVLWPRFIVFREPSQVRAFPLAPPPTWVIRSQPLTSGFLIRTAPDSMEVVHSSAESIAAVETQGTNDTYRELTDDDLLRLLAGRPIALVRHHQHRAELLFLDVDPADQPSNE